MVARKLSNKVTKYQVTDNGYPLYTFAGDTGPSSRTVSTSSSPPGSTGTW